MFARRVTDDIVRGSEIPDPRPDSGGNRPSTPEPVGQARREAARALRTLAGVLLRRVGG
jgi:hypothetical protein